VKSTDRVAVISTAHGLKFTNFKVAYHDLALKNIVAHYANPPIELPADYTAVQKTLDKVLS
jgi:threonine synthase